MAIVKYDPTEKKSSRGPWGFGRNLRQIFDDFLDFPKDWEVPMKGGELFPLLDISETAQEYTIRAEIPGMERADTKISVHNNVLTLSGEKKSEAKQEDKKYHRVENYYGSFQHNFVLPDAITAAKVSAAFKDGILTVTVPKTGEAWEKDVEIKIS
ncbi:MAG TPA: Hsp20/alpha crystallin family protein [bacterium]|jgi:HSP20 family protein|nr:Hsp20/alpha crystallin family protein [bacterium]